MFEKKTIIFEAYPRAEVLRIIEVQTRCAICGEVFGANNPPEIHSTTSLHIVKGVVTATPKGFERLRGRRIDPRLEPEGGDAKALCIKCHDELHRLVGNYASIEELQKATEFMIKRGKW